MHILALLRRTVFLSVTVAICGWCMVKAEAASPPIANPPSTSTRSLDHTPATNSALQTRTYNSRVLGQSRTYGVVLPPGYNDHPNQRYPVIFLLHGGHGNATDWLISDKGNVQATLQQLYANNKFPPSIIITPDGNDLRGSSRYWDPDYIDGANGRVATAIGDELVKVVQSRYRTLPTPNFWAIGGLSSGGWGAINVGLHHLQHFSVLFSHSGYFVDKSGAENSPFYFVETLPERDRKRLHIYLDSGSVDKRYLKQAIAFHQKLDQLGIVNEFMAFPGSHSWQYWREHLTDSLTFTGKYFQTVRVAQTSQPK